MSSTKKIIASDFHLSLNEAHDRWVNWRDTLAVSSMMNSYGALMKFVTDGSDETFETEALHFFAPLCNVAIDNDGTITNSVLDLMLQYFARNDVISKLLVHPGAEKALAWFTCHVAARYVYGKDFYGPSELQNQIFLIHIIENWSGKHLAYDEVPRLNNIVAHLYGEACWELLGYETIGPRSYPLLKQAVKTITTMNLPLVFRSREQETLSIPTALPSDLTV